MRYPPGVVERAMKVHEVIMRGLAIDVDGGSLLGWMPWDRYMAKRKRR